MDRLALLADCGRRLWTPHLGDADPLGLALTAGYLLVLVLMLRTVLSRTSRFQGPRDRQLWLLALAGFALLAANKQLDLQHYAMTVGRCYSQAQGWYKQRVGLERGAALAALASVPVLMLGLGYRFRSVLAANWPLILGLALLAAFVLLQMSGILHLEARGKGALGTLALNRAIEALALATLAAAAWIKARPAP